jgi:uncharacterized membrane protein YqjE
MAILTALLSALSRKLGTLIQALMGWSVAALFGRLNSRHRLLMNVALILSVLWPLFVVGVIFPQAAAMVLAFVPVHDFLSPAVTRSIWLALALLAPVGVGLLVRAVAGRRSTPVWKSIVSGYPLALGFALSFLVTAITVPLVRIASAARGWKEEHVYVQARPGLYEKVVFQLCEACLRSGVKPEVTKLPRSMALATQVIKFFARGGLDSLIVDDPKRLRAEGLELYLYPGDLLVRGEEHLVTRVRAVMNHTDLEHYAWLVDSPRAQHLQDELARIRDAMQRHEHLDASSHLVLLSRLKGIAEDSTQPGITYEDFIMLDKMTRRVEDALNEKKSVAERGSSAKALKTAKTDTTPEELVRNDRPALHTLASDATPKELFQAAIEETKELVKLEVALAKVEAQKQLKQAVKAAIGFAAAAVFALVGLSVLAMSIVLALGGTAGIAVAVGVICLAVGALAAFFGYGRLPKNPLEHTREHVTDDLKLLKEHLA